MKIYSLILLLTFSLPLMGQNTDSTNSAMLFGFSISSHADYRILNPEFDRSETTRYPVFYGFAVGGFVRIPVAKHFLLQTGLNLEAVGSRGIYTAQRPYSNYGLFSLSSPSPPVITGARYRWHNFVVSVPVMPTFYFGKGKWKHTVSLGPSMDLWVYSIGWSRVSYEYAPSETSKYSGSTLDDAEFINVFDIGAVISFGFETGTKKGNTIQIVPEAKVYSLLDFNENSFRTAYSATSGVKVIFMFGSN